MTYHVQLDESTRLPMSADSVRDFFRRGAVRLNTQIRRDDATEWTTAYELREELQLPAQTGGFAQRPVTTAEPIALPARKSSAPAFGIALIVIGALTAIGFILLYDTTVLRATPGLSPVDPHKVQNRMFGVGAGALMIMIGALGVIFRKR